MHRILALVAGVPNPGPHTPPGYHPLGIGSSMLGMVVGIIAIILGLILALNLGLPIRKDDWKLPTAALVVGATAMLAGICWAVHSGNSLADARTAADKAANDYEVAYNESVKQWLAGEYGITANDGSVNTLIHGGQLVASTKVGQKMIQLASTTDNELAIQIVGGDILQPADVDR